MAAQLQDTSGQVGSSPSLMSSWCGPGSSQFALLTGQEAMSLQSSATSVLMAGMELVPRDLHTAIKHTGGAVDVAQARDRGIAPGGVFTPFEQDAHDLGALTGGTAGVAGAQEGRP